MKLIQLVVLSLGLFACNSSDSTSKSLDAAASPAANASSTPSAPSVFPYHYVFGKQWTSTQNSATLPNGDLVEVSSFSLDISGVNVFGVDQERLDNINIEFEQSGVTYLDGGYWASQAAQFEYDYYIVNGSVTANCYDANYRQTSHQVVGSVTSTTLQIDKIIAESDHSCGTTGGSINISVNGDGSLSYSYQSSFYHGLKVTGTLRLNTTAP